MAEVQRRPGRPLPPPGRGPPPPPPARPAAPRLEPVDREKVLSLPLSIYVINFDVNLFLCSFMHLPRVLRWTADRLPDSICFSNHSLFVRNTCFSELGFRVLGICLNYLRMGLNFYVQCSFMRKRMRVLYISEMLN